MKKISEIAVNIYMPEAHTHTHTHAYLNFRFIYRYLYYLPTPPLGQDMTQGQFLSGV